MKKTNNSIEDIFQQSFLEHKVEPSAKVLTTLKRKLFIQDFFSLNYKKINFAYISTFVLAVIISAYFINNKGTNTLLSEIKTDKSNNNEENSVLKTRNNYQVLSNGNEYVSSIKDNTKRTLKAFYTTNTTEGCEPLSVKFNNKSHNAVEYKWDFGNGDNSNEANPVYIFSKAGIYKVKLFTTSINGAKAEFNQIIKVFSKPVSDFEINIAASDLSSKEIVFTNKSTNAIKYKWSFGDKTVSDAKEQKHEYSDFGKYNVRLISISENACTDTLTKTNSFIVKDYRLVFPKQFKPSLAGSNNGVYERPENKPFVFYPQNSGANEYQLTVSTLSGIQVFTTKNIKQGWNGYIRGSVAPEGIYTYKAVGAYPNGKEFILSGSVKLVIDNVYDNYNNY